MSRILIIAIFWISTKQLLGQELTGKYKDSYGCQIDLRHDSTFRFKWNFDLASSWTIGTWTMRKSKIQFIPTIIYDTLRNPNLPDSLILSLDEYPAVITYSEFAISLISSGAQNSYKPPFELLYQNNKLYYLDDEGEILKKKPKGINSKRLEPWYSKVE